MKSQLFSSAAFATTALFILSNAMPSNGQRQQFLRGKLYGYAAENDAECPGKSNFGYDDIPEGAEQMSGIPENLPAEIAGKLHKVGHDISDETFKNTLISAGKVPTLIDENNGIKSFYLFGDKGYKIPGYGGINNFDMFVAKDDFTLASFHDSFLNYVTGELCTKAEYEAGSTECTWDTPDGRYNLVTAQTWWSNPKTQKVYPSYRARIRSAKSAGSKASNRVSSAPLKREQLLWSVRVDREQLEMARVVPKMLIGPTRNKLWILKYINTSSQPDQSL